MRGLSYVDIVSNVDSMVAKVIGNIVESHNYKHVSRQTN